MITTEELTKNFKTTLAVDRLTLEVHEGEVFGFLGPNGAGKTTTVRMLTSVLSPTRGNAMVAGHDVVQYPEKVRASVGVLTEQHGLYLRMSGEEYLDFFGRIYRLDPGMRKTRSREWMEYFGLKDVVKQPIGQYSKGMRQKILLSAALLHDPDVLLLDEPLSGLDVTTGLIVDEVSEVVDIRTDQIDDSPSFGENVNTDYILGMGKCGAKVVMLLDIDWVLSREEISIVAQAAN